MIDLRKGQNVTVYLTGETSFDRVVAKCFLDDGRDLAAEMVKLELALDIPMFPDADYKHLETPNARRKLRWKLKS
jgi:endonuclease YncB( thermonuclease family)